MSYLYELEIQSFSNGEEMERYNIGIFRTRKDAETTARRYLSEVKGFRDYYCEYSIRESELVGNSCAESVYTYYGWNVDEDGNEYDIVDGFLYSEMEAAEAAMESVKDAYDRQEWVLESSQIGKCEFAEGFVREYPDGRTAPTLPELRAQLAALASPRTACGIDFEYGDEPLTGFPLAVGSQLFLVAVDIDFQLNGFTVRRLRDIRRVKARRAMYQTVVEQEGLTKFKVPRLGISDWRSVFTSLQKMDMAIIVEREYEPSYFRLGRIESVQKDQVVMRYFNADGVWQEPVEIPYHYITSVTFDDRYANTFSKYV